VEEIQGRNLGLQKSIAEEKRNLWIVFGKKKLEIFRKMAILSFKYWGIISV
jgi:hypothetical protein